MYRCLNKQKIKTINRKQGFVVCKCWPNDKDNLCHWRLFGNNMAVDKEGFKKSTVLFTWYATRSDFSQFSFFRWRSPKIIQPKKSERVVCLMHQTVTKWAPFASFSKSNKSVAHFVTLFKTIWRVTVSTFQNGNALLNQSWPQPRPQWPRRPLVSPVTHAVLPQLLPLLNPFDIEFRQILVVRKMIES